jgi:carboxyl-terminal processing protease
LALLMDAGCFSSTEMFIAALADSGRARTVGQTSGGGSGNPVSFKLTGNGVAAFSTGDFVRMNGQRVEGKGIAPDIAVRRTLEDFREGRDPELQAAEAYLLSTNP